MNNELNNNNNTSNELNGSVLGNVNNMPNQEPETLETLDVPVNSTMVNNQSLMNNDVQVNTQSQFFNEPINNEPMGQVNPAPTPNVVQTPVTPQPAYTNPQNINPMPGFENSNVIGTTPPVSLEPEKKPAQKKSNKTLFVIIIIVLLFGVGFGTFYVLKYTDLLNNKPTIQIDAKDLQFDLGTTLPTNISDYATITGTDVRNCTISTSEVDTSKEGIYNYQITCGEIFKSGKVTIVDNTELEVNTVKIYKAVGDTVEAKEFIDNANEGYTYEFVDSQKVTENLKTIGTYKVTIKAISGSKTKEVEAELVVLQYRIKGYLTCSSKEQNVVGLSAKMIVSEKFAISDGGGNSFGNVAMEEYTFKFSDETEYTNYVAKYKTDGSITLNNITGKTIFDDENLTITITNDLDSENVINEYGKDNMTNYGSIKGYFETTLGYSCGYKMI